MTPLTLQVSVIDYGAGNLHSVLGALERAGESLSIALRARLATSGRDLRSADAAVLPGVGSFAAAMDRLDAQGFSDAVRALVARGRPLLGICLGMQVLFTGGDEGGPRPGLGLLPGWVRALPDGVKRPHMGWNKVLPCREDPLLPRGPQPFYAYFAHGYAAEDVPADAVVAVCRYGGLRLVAAVRAGQVFGTQFHPERSGADGQWLFAAFLRAAAAAHAEPAAGPGVTVR